MSYQAFLNNILPQNGDNITSPDNITTGGRLRVRNVPTQLFEFIIPGYSPIHSFILDTFAFDITIFVTLFAVIWVMMKLLHYVYRTIYSFIEDKYMASVLIGGYDDIYQHLLKWLADQPHMKNSRLLMAETMYKSAWEDDGEDEDDDDSNSEDGTSDYLNFSNFDARTPPRFVPSFGTHAFWHNGTYFRLTRVKNTVAGNGWSAFTEKEDIYVSCFGRSPAPIKKLLQDAKNLYHADHQRKTVIRRPASKEMRRYGGRSCWNAVANRPCRPMDTVVLDSERKKAVLEDINEYLNPTTPRWYSNRGIPYRRGYLFHGPPGTGKTSLSFAIAGVFGLDIYVISLLEPTLSEEDLNLLFTSLPRRCVVLLEDIDTAGLLRSDADDDKETKETKTKSGKKSRGKKPKPKKSNSGSDSGSGLDSDESDSNESTTEETKKDDRPVKVSDIAKYFKKANRMSEEDERKRISLSGLLNAIDGVASHEGRVLVMTTNKPEKLDDALIRPGRVDLQVAFGNASTKQIEELFVRMYSSDQKGATKKLASKDTKKEPHGAALSPAKAKAAINAAASTILSANPFRAFVLTPPRTPPETPVEHDTSITATATTMQSDTTTANTVLPPDATAVGTPTTPEEDLPLPEIAHRFAGLIPDGQFSPAEIQGFLLKRKKDPVKALREVEKWVASMVEAKKGGGKVLDVQ